MKNFDFTGTGVALVTPFNSDNSIDYNSLEKLLSYVENGGVDYLVLMGTTGESVTLRREEKNEILDFVRYKSNCKLPIVLGIGGYDTQAVLSGIEDTNFDNISALLSVAPYYNKPSQEGLFQHFTAIADTCPVPIILYNVPGRAAINMSAKTILRLAQHKNIKGVKEASGDFTQIMDIIDGKPQDFHVISGDDAITYPMMCLGASGVISVIANILPKQFSDMVRKNLNSDFAGSKKLHYSMLNLNKLLFIEGSPSGIKAALNAKGIIQNNLRMPLVPVSENTWQLISKEISKF